ncbi:MAG: right-handed parallel beta-helix repeat-containing protein, partial [Candidatus Freyarchaeota archaeon]|nr:right-handed parallel beta-helix repeat-containing protein [Candidatus Jordarchaeia archaeon]
REKHMKHQRAIEAHKMKMEKKLTEKKSRQWRKSKIILAASLFTIILIVYAAWQSTKPPATSPQEPESSQQTPESPSGVIYIRPDGNGRVDPATAPINKVKEDYYKFTGNVTLPIIVLKKNIVIDGAGYFLKGNGTIGSKGIDLSYRENVTVINLKIEGFDYGLYLDTTTNTVISNNDFINNYCGIWLTSASNNKITANNISNENYGIWLKNSTNNFIAGNKITSHNYTIYLGYSSDNTIHGNNIANNKLGIFLYSSSNNTISHNNITKNSQGIHLLNSTKNLITLNNITQNDIGISFDESSNNTTHHNNFIDNINHTNVENSTNIWDDDCTKEGNYWSDYTGIDSNADGVGDIPYIIDEKNQDRYPLTKPIS